MGNQLIKGYSIQKESRGQCGVNGNWKMYDGTKHGTNEPVTIWMIDKKSLKKADREEVLRQAKKEAAALAKFRHPGILSICEMPLEDEYSLAFVTERIEGNISHFLKTNRSAEVCSSELEIRIQISGILETLNFVHTNVKMAHLAIHPDNIYVTPGGKWKLGGLLFAQSMGAAGQGNSIIPLQPSQRDMSYFAPEMVEGQCCFASDSFSAVVLIVNLVSAAAERHTGGGAPRQLITAHNKGEYHKHQDIIRRIESHPYITESNNPEGLAKLARQGLAWNWQQRAGIAELSRCEWLNDNFILTIKHLENITALQQKRQFEFIKGLEQILFKFEPAVIKKRIIPALLGLLKFDYLIAAVVITIVEVMKKEAITVSQFQKTIWSELRNVTTSKEIPAHALYIFVENVEVFTKYLSLQDLNASIVPLFLKCFDCPPKLKETALKKVPYLTEKLDYQFLKTKVLPRLLNLLADKTEQVRKVSVIVVYKCVAAFDLQAIQQILAALEKSRRLGQDSFFNAITLKLYQCFAQQMTAQQIGDKIVPSLLPFLVDPSLTRSEFQMYKSTILALLGRIEDVRSKTFSVDEGHVYTETDFDFPKQKTQEVRQNTNNTTSAPSTPPQPNFQFLSLFNNPGSSGTTANSISPKSDNFAPSVQQTPLEFSTSPVSTSSGVPSSVYSPPNLQTKPSQTTSNISSPQIKKPPSLAPPPQPVSQYTPQTQPQSTIVTSKPVSVNQASNEFFSGLGDSPNRPKPNLKGPPKQQPQIAPPPMYNPPAMNYNLNQKVSLDEAFADLQSFKPSTAPVAPLAQTNNNMFTGGLGNFGSSNNNSMNNNFMGISPSTNLNSNSGLQFQNSMSNNRNNSNNFVFDLGGLGDLGGMSKSSLISPTPSTFGNPAMTTQITSPPSSAGLNGLNMSGMNKPKRLAPPPATNKTVDVSNIKGDDFFDLL